jgi:methyltransferase (TIGR00027 family)
MPETDSTRASVTALATALMRAAHTRLDRPALVDDPWGDRLVLPAESEAIGIATAMGLDPEEAQRIASLGSPQERTDAALRAHPTYATVVLRARYTEDALEEAVAGGVRQYVLVGAGMDSFALRQPGFARELEIFEVDLPATQEFKRRRLEELGVALPARLHLVGADLSRGGLDAALDRSAFRPDSPAFFSWLGVSAYLTRDANMSTLRAIGGLAAGSELVFTYIEQGELGADAARGELEAVRRTLAAAGEPWVSGFHPGELGGDLASVGLALVEDLNGIELARRYDPKGAVGLVPAEAAHVARAALSP